MSTINGTIRPKHFGSIFEDLFERSISDIVGADYMQQTPSVNVIETDENFQLQVAAPGLSKEDFDITIEKDHLTIAADTQAKEGEITPAYTRREYSYQKFARRFTLPKTVDKESIRAQYDLGLLTVTIDKTDDAKTEGPKTIEIK